MRLRCTRVFLTAVLLCLPCSLAWSDDPKSWGWDDAADGVNSIIESVGDLMLVVIGFAALIVLVRVVFDLMRGERESARKFFWWLLGLCFGFSMLTIMK